MKYFFMNKVLHRRNKEEKASLVGEVKVKQEPETECLASTSTGMRIAFSFTNSNVSSTRRSGRVIAFEYPR